MEEGKILESPDQAAGRKDKRKKIIVWSIGLILVVVAVFLFLVKPSAKTESGSIPKLIQADFIDLSKIYSISKFRSGSGHDFSGNGETCRSMKHYFNTQWTTEGQKMREANNNLPPSPDGVNDVAIYSPVDGEITGIATEKMPIGVQIYIKPNSDPDYTIRLFHIYTNDGIKKGSKLTAGREIGKISQYSNTDIAIMKRSLAREQYFSYFEMMPDDLFAKYIARGVTKRDDLILSKEYRDSHPLECNGEQFSQNYDSDSSSGNFSYLSGYIGLDQTNGQ